MTETEVVVDGGAPATVRVPDVLVVDADVIAANVPRLRAADLLLAIEIVSPGSRRQDRITKFAEYAEVGIPHYWILDLDEPANLQAYELADGAYRQIAEGSATVGVNVPVPTANQPARARRSVRLDTLVPGRARIVA